MWIRSKKAILAIEWVWLLIATAAIFAHLVEAWASPYLPALWMLGVLGLFLTYRVGMAVREVYWPEPEPEIDEQPMPAGIRRGGDGMVSTTEWVPPQMRGRKKEMRQFQQGQSQQSSADEPSRLELPAASGRFDGADVNTVFAQVDEDTEPESSADDASIPFLATSIVRVDKKELRPETEADISHSDVIIPSFAESALTGNQRKRALDGVGDEAATVTRPGPKRPAGSEADTVTQPGPHPLIGPGPDADTITRPGPKPPVGPDDDTNPMQVKDGRRRSDDEESR